MQLKCLLRMLFVTAFISVAHGCSVVNWSKMSMQKRLFLSDIVVYGKDLEHVNITRNEYISYKNMLFRVYCIFKGDPMKISQNITIERIWPQNSCSETHIGVGDEVIVALKETENGNYRYHEVNVMQTAAWPPYDENFDTVLSVCGLQKPVRPIDRYATNYTLLPQCEIIMPPHRYERSCTNTAQQTKQKVVDLNFLIFLIILFINYES